MRRLTQAQSLKKAVQQGASLLDTLTYGSQRTSARELRTPSKELLETIYAGGNHRTKSGSRRFVA